MPGRRWALNPSHIGVASTGVIGRYLDLPAHQTAVRTGCTETRPHPGGRRPCGQGDHDHGYVPKHALVKKEGFTIGGITKGSGMIAPNMGTMLAFIYTDAEIGAKPLADALKLATQRSFNRVVVDGDTSTNDIALCTATGEAGKVKAAEFSAALEECCRSLAEQIAADGEGATKLLQVTVTGAKKEDDAGKGCPDGHRVPAREDRGVRRGPELGPGCCSSRARRREVRPERGLALDQRWERTNSRW